jgi:hypothetical protein
MTVLILAAEFDVSADQMILALRDREVPVCRVDTAWFPACLHLEAQLQGGYWRGRLRTPGRDIDLAGLPEAVRRFARCGATVTKMLGANHIAEEGTRKVTFTRLLTDDDLADLRGINVTAHQFQQWAPKQHDTRVIAIGDKLFAFAIYAGNATSYINTDGQFGWLEARTGAPLTEALADLLTGGARS